MSYWTLGLFCVGVGVALVALFICCGYMLAVDVTLTTSRFLAYPPGAVWRGLADHESNPVTGQACRSQRPFGTGDMPGWVEQMGSSSVVVKTVESNKPTLLVRHFDDRGTTMTSRMVYQMEAAEEEGVRGTRITMIQDVSVPRGTWHTPLFRILVRIFGTKGMTPFLARLNRYLGRT